MPIHQTARTFGSRRVPTLFAASGCWQLGEVTQARRAGVWPNTADPFYSEVVLLLPLTGSNGSTTFTDASQSPKSITAFGNASISTAVADPFSVSAGVLALDGTGDYLTAADNTDFDLDGDFTIELWFYAASAAVSGLLSYKVIGGTGFTFGPSTTTSKLWWRHNGTNYIVASSTFTSSTWEHAAVVRSGSTVTMYLGGNSVGSYSETKTFSPAADVFIGSTEFSEDFNGYVSNLRITKAARYTAAFTPPTSPFRTA